VDQDGQCEGSSASFVDSSLTTNLRLSWLMM